MSESNSIKRKIKMLEKKADAAIAANNYHFADSILKRIKELMVNE